MYRHYLDEVDNVYIILQNILFRKQCTNYQCFIRIARDL